MNSSRLYFKYVSQNILGLLGVSCYILADTFFIARATGSDGITVLNLCLPIYNLIFAFGSMLGLGSATRFAILRSQEDPRAHRYFASAVLWACLLSVPFVLAGVLCPGALLRLMGGDAAIVALGEGYARIFLLFTPFFMCNYIVSAFVRNDGDPSLAMAATLSGSLFNVVADYLFIFPLGLGLPGAALATAVSPVLSIAVCSLHFCKRENAVRFEPHRPSARLLAQSCQLGVSGFVGEMSSGVTTTVFNFLLLGLAGNVGVAAYGVVANYALVATAIFNGVAQGAQPLISRAYGQRDQAEAQKLLRLSAGTALVLAAALYAGVYWGTEPLVALFNQEHDP
ncbi:MAG: MATE family efflux transporter, partial [Faecalibacterium sp.]